MQNDKKMHFQQDFSQNVFRPVDLNLQFVTGFWLTNQYFHNQVLNQREHAESPALHNTICLPSLNGTDAVMHLPGHINNKVYIIRKDSSCKAHIMTFNMLWIFLQDNNSSLPCLIHYYMNRILKYGNIMRVLILLKWK